MDAKKKRRDKKKASAKEGRVCDNKMHSVVVYESDDDNESASCICIVEFVVESKRERKFLLLNDTHG